MELIMALFLNFLGCLPAILITVVGFFINPILGVGLGLFFFAIAVCSATYTINKIRKQK